MIWNLLCFLFPNIGKISNRVCRRPVRQRISKQCVLFGMGYRRRESKIICRVVNCHDKESTPCLRNTVFCSVKNVVVHAVAVVFKSRHNACEHSTIIESGEVRDILENGHPGSNFADYVNETIDKAAANVVETLHLSSNAEGLTGRSAGYDINAVRTGRRKQLDSLGPGEVEDVPTASAIRMVVVEGTNARPVFVESSEYLHPGIQKSG